MAITKQHLEELIEERCDPDATVKEQAAEAAKLVRDSKHLMVLTGAGLSTAAGISCYRGPDGVWTCKAQGRSVNLGTPIPEAVPTLSHLGLVALQEAGLLAHVGTQNVDHLHIRSGLKIQNLTEVHGNIFKERCCACGNEYIREAPVYQSALDSGDEAHYITGTCSECGGTLRDSLIHFGEEIHPEHLDTLFAHAAIADVCLVLGTSLAVRPFNELPRDVKAHGGHVIIVNMQKTPLDALCADDGVRVFAQTDRFMHALLDALELTLPEWRAARPVEKSAVRRRIDVEKELAKLREAKMMIAGSDAPSIGFCVVPSATCAHAQEHCQTSLRCADLTGPCEECGHRGETWVCGLCQIIHCGRYVNGHMLQHAKETGHCIAFSLSDSSVWCNACDCYVDEGAVAAVQPLYQQIYHKKHGEWDPRPLLRSWPDVGGA